jgi:hypothetical protein
MYTLLPYLWMLFMVAIIITTIVAAIRSRPKKAPKVAAADPIHTGTDPLMDPEAEPAMDFGDELAAAENK